MTKDGVVELESEVIPTNRRRRLAGMKTTRCRHGFRIDREAAGKG